MDSSAKWKYVHVSLLKLLIIQECDSRAVNPAGGTLWAWGLCNCTGYLFLKLALKVDFDRIPSSSHMSISVTQVPPFNFKRCLDFSPPPSLDSEAFSCATVWGYSIRKLCKCWEAGFLACGKHSGEFLDSLVPRQTARCWHTICELLFENWAPQLRVCRCWRMWLPLALCLATCMWVFYRRIISVVLSLFMLLI